MRKRHSRLLRRKTVHRTHTGQTRNIAVVHLTTERLEDSIVRRIRPSHGFHHLLRQTERWWHKFRVFSEQVPGEGKAADRTP